MMNTLAMSLLFACAGVLLAWLLRRPARRLAGVGPAFGLWLLPLLLGAMAWLPAWHPATAGSPAMLTLPVLLVGPSVTARPEHGISLAHVMIWLWAGGCALMLARLVVHNLRIARKSRPLPETMYASLRPQLEGFHRHAIRLHPAGPAVFWMPRCRLLLPHDLLQRFSAAQRIHVLAHERMHLRRRDPYWNLLAEMMLAALWFFPPAWLAMACYRLDQELACDAAVVRMSPRETGAYARTLLASATVMRVPVAGAPWLTRSQLKARLNMLQHHSQSAMQRRGGYAALTILLAGIALTAHATLPGEVTSPDQSLATTAAPDGTRAHVVEITRIKNPPQYPPAAIKNHQQGTVVLLIHVDASGNTTKIKQASTTSHAPRVLVTAAIQAASKWQFTPAYKNGEAVAGWARVPVTFSLKPMDVEKTRSTPASPTQTRKPPHYPAAAIKHRQQGTVMLMIHVDTHGNPVEITYDKKATTAPMILVAAAVKAAAQWRFEPSHEDGKAATHWVRTPVTFALPKDDKTAAPPHTLVLLPSSATASSSR